MISSFNDKYKQFQGTELQEKKEKKVNNPYDAFGYLTVAERKSRQHLYGEL